MAPPTPGSAQTALLTTASGTLSASSAHPIPSCSPANVLVSVHAVALNPSDVKMPALLRTPSLVGGCDFAGEIVAVGTEANALLEGTREQWRVGERVCGAVLGCNLLRPTEGSFAQYVEADPLVLVRVPEEWGWEKAAAVGGSCVGAVGMGLFWKMGLEMEGVLGEGWGKGDGKEVLVYGASTACGTIALQVLKRAGYAPIGVCSTRNFELIEEYGAVKGFDYSSDACGAEIKKYTKGGLSLALDCIGTVQSTTLCFAALGRGGGRYVALEKTHDAVTSTRKAVKSDWAMGPLMFGRKIDMGSDEYRFAVDEGAREFGRRWYAVVEMMLEEGLLEPHPVKVLGGQRWTDSVLSGLEMVRKGQVSGEKLVVIVK